MPLITVSDLSIRFRGPALLDGVSCLIDNGERIGLLGRNGAGKTSFLKILAGQLEPDHGRVQLSNGARVALLRQDVPNDLSGSVRQVVLQGVHRQSTGDAAEAAELDWQAEHRVDQITSRMELDPDAQVAAMSSGLKRRVLLAQALVDRPDVLLLDEPTNHLDIDAITWLEGFLSSWPATLIFITHDRQFLRSLATRILEIEAGQLFDWTCDYPTFLRRKLDALAAQEKQDALFDKRLAEEEVWIRQGIKARRTRNEGRVRRLEQMRLARSQRSVKTGTAQLQIQEGMRSGNLVAELSEVSFAHPGTSAPTPILEGFSSTIMRGDKLGIIGRNGTGKTTLLKIMLGKLQPDSGRVRLGSNLQIAYFDQLRDQLDEEKTVEEDVADGYQSLTIDGRPRHVLGYLQDFLFSPERARTPIKFLSGGERNRVLLAKLFAKPANVIVLDEPTNDLDAETLEMLEERLVEYQGTLLVVSHDREFLNNVVTSCIAFEALPDGRRAVNEYVGGYDDWQRQVAQRSVAEENLSRTAANGKKSQQPDPVSAALTPKKLSFREQRELEAIPAQIEKIEAQLAARHASMADPQFYKQSGTEISSQQRELKELDQQLSDLYARWQELDAN